MNKTTNLSEFVTSDPNSAILDHEAVGATIHERARISQRVLQDVSTGTVSTQGFKELVLTKRPDDPTPWYVSTGTFFKVFEKYEIDNETWLESSAVNDGFYQAVCATDEGENKLQGLLDTIVSAKHMSIETGTGESWKGDEVRNYDYFPALSSMLTGNVVIDPSNPDHSDSTINLLIDAEARLPSSYQEGAKYYMNRRTRSVFRKLRNTDGSLILSSNDVGEFSLFGYPVVIYDSISDVPTAVQTDNKAATWLMFGNLEKALKVSDFTGSEKFINNPYKEGYKELKYESKYGVYALDTTALILVVMADEGIGSSSYKQVTTEPKTSKSKKSK